MCSTSQESATVARASPTCAANTQPVPYFLKLDFHHALNFSGIMSFPNINPSRWTLRTVSVKKPALYAWVDIAGEKNPFSDNYIHLRPGDPVELKVQISSRTDVDTLKRGLLQGVSSI